MKTLTAFFYHRGLTLFVSKETWYLHLFWTTYALGLALILTYIDEDQKYSKTALGLFDGAMLEFRNLSAFVIAGFILLTISGWRERRCHYTNLCATCKALLLILASTLPSIPNPDEDSAMKAAVKSMMENHMKKDTTSDVLKSRQQLGRWVLAAHEMTVMTARGHGDSDEAREFMISGDFALLDQQEWDAMIPNDRNTSIFLWIMLKCKLIMELGHITPIEFTHLLSATTAMRTISHDLMARLSVDLPYPYASTIGYLVHIVVFLQARGTLHVMGWMGWDEVGWGCVGVGLG